MSKTADITISIDFKSIRKAFFLITEELINDEEIEEMLGSESTLIDFKLFDEDGLELEQGLALILLAIKMEQQEIKQHKMKSKFRERLDLMAEIKAMKK